MTRPLKTTTNATATAKRADYEQVFGDVVQALTDAYSETQLEEALDLKLGSFTHGDAGQVRLI